MNHPSVQMPRALRRRLEREADRIVDAVSMQPLPDGLDVATSYGIARRGQPLAIVCPVALDLFAASIGDHDLRAVIDADRREGSLPIVVLLPHAPGRGWACVAHLRVLTTTAPGGDA